jgi:LDH2 family malate/lactate/ureidoglycolate dehydrogenase
LKKHDPAVVRRLVQQFAEAAGVPAGDARILADSLVEADIQGTSTHGVSRLNIYLRRIQKGLIDPRAELVVEQRRPAVLVVDAGSGLGQVQAAKVLERLYGLAHTHGLASATIKNSQHFGTLGWYCNQAAERGMVLIATTNAEPAMPPFGSSEAFFGTNPIGASFPTGKGFPVKIDLATSVVARGNIVAAAKRGESIPGDWALDKDGMPTTDANAALAGAVLTLAGHKGYALAFMVEAFSSILSGSAIGADIGSMYKHMDRKQNVGHFFCLLDIAAFMDLTEFKARIDETIDRIKAARLRPGFEEILVPGEPEYRTAQKNRVEGIKIDDATLGELRTLAQEYGVEFPLG